MGHSLMTIETDSAAAQEEVAEKQQETSSSSSSSSPDEEVARPTSGPGKDNSSKVLSTPAVRHMAKQNNIDISQVNATGKGGRVTKEDLLNFMNKDSFVKEPAQAAAPAPPQVK